MNNKIENAEDARIQVDIINCDEKERDMGENPSKKESETTKGMNVNKTIEIRRKLYSAAVAIT